MKLTSKQESDICLSCGECCRRYSITIFPEEVKAIAKSLNISQKKFLEKHCELFVKVYPKSIPGMLTYNTAFFPKKVGKLLEQEFNYVPNSFFVLPQISLKRAEGVCRYLNKDNSCIIYNDRPFPCRLFPFMVVPGYEENYPFCELFKKSTMDYSKQSRKYSKKMKDYFKLIDEKGFFKTWRAFPPRGKLFLSDLLIGEITIKQLNKMLSYKKEK